MFRLLVEICFVNLDNFITFVGKSKEMSTELKLNGYEIFVIMDDGDTDLIK